MRLCGPVLQCWLFVGMMAGAAAGQQASPPQQSKMPTIRARSNLVLVPALVQDSTGELIYSLKADDFSVFDNGVEQKIHLEEDLTPQPVALVVVLQDGRTAPRQYGYLHGLTTMMESIVGEAPFQAALVRFDSKPKIASDFSASLDPIREALKHPAYGDDGDAILDSVAFALRMLDQQPGQYRRAILLISETRDHGSRVHKDDLIRDIGASNTAVYSIAFSPALTQFKDELAHGGHGNKPYNLSVLLPPVTAYFDLTQVLTIAVNGMRENAAEEIAGLSGGEYIRFDNQREFDSNLNKVANHFPNRYLLSFQPSSPKLGLHPLVVLVKNHPEYVISARATYWATNESQVPPVH